MLRYFRINDPYRLTGLFVLMTLLYLPVFIDSPDLTLPGLKGFIVGESISAGELPYGEVVDNTPPLAAYFYSVTEWLFGRSQLARYISGFIVIFLQAVFIAVVFIDKKAFPENTYIPAFIFSMLAFISFDVILLHADLAAFGFMLLALNNLIKEIEFKEQRDETILNLGIFISIASLLNFSFIVYLPGAVLIIAVFSRGTIRKYLLLIFGFALPHLLLVCLYFINGHVHELLQFYYVDNFGFTTANLVGAKSLLVLCSLPILYLVIALFILNREARLTKYQSQLLQIMFIWFLLALLQVFYTRDLRPQSLITLLPSAAFFLTHFFLLIRRKKFVEINTWVLLFGVISTAYLTRYEKINSVDLRGLFVPVTESAITDKKILILDNNPSLLARNYAATGFINWELSQKIFENPGYYENVLKVSRAFKTDPPTVIIDPENYMEAFFERIPALKQHYRKVRGGWERTISN